MMLHDVFALDELAVGKQRAVDIKALSVLVCHDAAGLYAIENRCSHAAMPLEGGRVVKCAIRCPFHGAKFNLDTGKPASGSRLRPLEIFKVSVIKGRVCIEL